VPLYWRIMVSQQVTGQSVYDSIYYQLNLRQERAEQWTNVQSNKRCHWPNNRVSLWPTNNKHKTEQSFNVNAVCYNSTYHNSPLSIKYLTVVAEATGHCCLVYLDNTVDLGDEPETSEEPDGACSNPHHKYLQKLVTISFANSKIPDRDVKSTAVLLADYVITGNGLKNGVHSGL